MKTRAREETKMVFTRRTAFAWFGILCLSVMFLMVQDSWPHQCFGDTGYGEVDEGCVGSPMAHIPAGSFDMGDHTQEGYTDKELQVFVILNL